MMKAESLDLQLPEGVRVSQLEDHQDDRGQLTELYRKSWAEDEFEIIQWNAVRSEAKVLRGVHAHREHWDYLTVVQGEVLFGLHDLRRGSSTEGLSAMVTLRGEATGSLVIPPGVAHGFYFPQPSIYVYGVSAYWNMEDELGCHFQAPELKLVWPDHNPRLSPRDQEQVPYQQLVEDYHR